jgi:3-phenylpropionate/trans-cinnamate dioxygenase ferredoxin component
MADPTTLTAVEDLGESRVTVATGPHGRLAVGIAAGEPFAVSNRCRHLGAYLGQGRVTDDGCLECPWHHARYDVKAGTMTRGPQGAVFAPVREVVRLFTNTFARLKRYPVVERDGNIELLEP